MLLIKPVSTDAQVLCDNFEYAVGTFLTSNGWIAYSSNGINPILVVSGNLSYPGYISSGIGSSVLISNTGGEDVCTNFLVLNDGNVYCAFLAKVVSATANGDFFFHFGTNTSGTDVRGRIFVRAVPGGINFGISKSKDNGVYSNTVYSLDSVYLLVLKYTFNEANSIDDIVSLYVNPPMDLNEPEPLITAGYGENDATNNINIIALRQGDPADAPKVVIDGFRVGLTWNETPMPVSMLYFNSVVNKESVTLNWATAYEINNKGFDIERKQSSDKNPWEHITFVTGNGTTWNNNLYQYTDRISNSGSYQYRLKQIDYNGFFAYYNLDNDVDIAAPGNYSLEQNYPNPFNPKTTIDYQLAKSNYVQLIIYDAAGIEAATLVNQKQNAGSYKVEWNASGHPSGIYFYRLTVTDGSITLFSDSKKLILLK